MSQNPQFHDSEVDDLHLRDNSSNVADFHGDADGIVDGSAVYSLVESKEIDFGIFVDREDEEGKELDVDENLEYKISSIDSDSDTWAISPFSSCWSSCSGKKLIVKRTFSPKSLSEKNNSCVKEVDFCEELECTSIATIDSDPGTWKISPCSIRTFT